MYRWVQRFTPLLAEAARARASAVPATGGLWMRPMRRGLRPVDTYLYRAVDQRSQVISVRASIPWR